MNRMSEESVFEQALARPAGEREAFLDTACGGDAAMQARIAALLRGHEEASGFLQEPLAAQALAAAAPDLSAKGLATAEENPSDTIGLTATGSAKAGRYKLLEKIGEGGCGVVWLAEQSEPVRRRVALKVIKLGMDTKEMIARFEAERQALALMNHPNIARVFDGGATETGRPYFVMELVRGLPITKFCDERALGLRERIELFIAVCEAVQHAHQKGIIHRDLKPSNILVTDGGDTSGKEGKPRRETSASPSPATRHSSLFTPKVIDFGIAKATQGRLIDATLHTAVHQFIGTPAYMSPEQAELGGGADIDTRSDLYSLGVLLYELLTGETPFERGTLERASLEEIRERIRTAEPPRPSARVRTRELAPASRRSAESASAAGTPCRVPGAAALRGDLDWIVMRCLEKDRTRRYETANALAMDLRRHLAHEPVLARPPSAAYLFQKLVRRHRLAFGAAGAIAATLGIGIAASTWQAVRATRAEHEQSRQRSRAEAQELATRRRAYGADMNLAQQALAVDNLGRARELLDRHRPNPAEPDLRGWEWRHLWERCQSDAFATVVDQPLWPARRSLAISPDGQFLAFVVQDQNDTERRMVKVLDRRTQEQIEVPIWSIGGYRLAFSPREPLLAVAGPAYFVPPTASGSTQQPGRLLVWNAATQRPVFEQRLPADEISGLFFSNDGATLLTFSSGVREQFTFWRSADGARLRTVSIPFAVKWPATVTNDFRLAAVMESHPALAAEHNTLRVHVLDLEHGVPLWNVAGPAGGQVFTMAFSSDGAMIAVATQAAGSPIILYDTRSGTELGRLEGHRSRADALLFLPDGKTLVSAGSDQTIRFWDVGSRQLQRTLRGHAGKVLDLAYLPDQSTLFSLSEDSRVLSWDTHKPLAAGFRTALPAQIAAWRFDGDSVVAIETSGTIARRRGRHWEDRAELMSFPHVPAPVRDRIHLAREVPLVAIVSRSEKVEVWDWERRARVAELAASGGPVTRVEILDRTRALLGNLQEVQEWDLVAGRKIRSWPGMGLFTVSPDGQRVLGLGSGRFTLVERGGQTIRQAPAPRVRSWVTGNFSPDGRFAAFPVRDYETQILDGRTLEPIRLLNPLVPAHHGVAFSPDSRRLVTVAGGIEAVRLWDVETWEPLLTLDAPTIYFQWAGFSPDGNALGALNVSGELHLWRAPSWAEIAAAEVLAAPKP